MRISRRLAVALIVLMVAGCGAGDDTAAVDNPDEITPELACSGLGERFSAELLQGPQLSADEFATTPLGEILAAELVFGEAAVEGGSFRESVGFSVASDTLVLGYQGGSITSFYELGEDGDLRGWGGCNPTYVRGDQVATRWEPADPYDPTAIKVPISVSGGACITDDGTEVTTQIESIDVSSLAGSVEVTVWTSERSAPGEFCAGVGVFLDAEIELTEPLGDRTLVDGGVVPPIRHPHEIEGGLGTYTCGSAFMQMSTYDFAIDAVGYATPEDAVAPFLIELGAGLTLRTSSSSDGSVIIGFTDAVGRLVASASVQRINATWLVGFTERCDSLPEIR